MRKNIPSEWGIYWIIILAIYTGLSMYWQSFSVFLLIPILGAFYFGVRLIFGLVMVPIHNLHIRRWLTAAVTCTAIVTTAFLLNAVILNGSNYNEPYISSLDYSVFHHQSTIRYDSESGVYTVRAAGDTLRILQLTDIHIGASFATIATDRKAFNACYETIKKAEPDLIVVTGDISFATFQTFSRNNLK